MCWAEGAPRCPWVRAVRHVGRRSAEVRLPPRGKLLGVGRLLRIVLQDGPFFSSTYGLQSTASPTPTDGPATLHTTL
jgi:hypothetical protein